MEKSKEDIYNIWLAETAKANSRPYRRRKNFDGLSSDDVAALEKLERIFKNFPGVSIADYFRASYALQQDDRKYIPLIDFSTPRAMRVYLDSKSSDMSESDRLDRFMRGMAEISKRCADEKIKLSEYIGNQKNGTYRWIQDYSAKRIFNENLIVFDVIGFNVAKCIRQVMPRDEIEMVFDGSIDSILDDGQKISSKFRNTMVSVLKKTNELIKRKISIDNNGEK